MEPKTIFLRKAIAVARLQAWLDRQSPPVPAPINTKDPAARELWLLETLAQYIDPSAQACAPMATTESASEPQQPNPSQTTNYKLVHPRVGLGKRAGV